MVAVVGFVADVAVVSIVGEILPFKAVRSVAVCESVPAGSIDGHLDVLDSFDCVYFLGCDFTSTGVRTTGYVVVVVVASIALTTTVDLQWMTTRPDFLSRTSNIERQYTASIFVALLMLVGENVEPQTVSEMWVSNVAMIFGSLYLASLFGQVAILVGNLNRTDNRYKERLDDVNEFMRALHIPLKVRRRVNHYYEYVWRRTRCLNTRYFLNDLSPTINKSHTWTANV